MTVARDIASQQAPAKPAAEPDATIEAWVKTVHEALPSVEDQAAQEALRNLVSWMSGFTPRIVRKLAARFHVSRPVMEDVLEDLNSVIRVFLTCPASEHPAACAGVTAYVRYVEAAVARSEEPRSFRKWCFFGTRTRLFSYLKQTFRAYGAPPELFRARESGQRARRRLVQSGQLVEYLPLSRQGNGIEIWCHRVLHPQGQRPLNAIPSEHRRFLSKSEAELRLEFLLMEDHLLREQALLERLNNASGIFEVQFLGRASNPALLVWIFEKLHEPFPLLGTTLDAILTASSRFRSVDPATALIDDFEDSF